MLSVQPVSLLLLELEQGRKAMFTQTGMLTGRDILTVQGVKGINCLI